MSILSWLIPNALAADTAATATTAATHQGGSLMSILPMLVAFIAIFYFLIIRPQSKRAKEQRELMSKLAKGDEVVTAGGITGKIAKVSDNFMVITIAPGVDITVQKNAVVNTLPKGTLDAV